MKALGRCCTEYVTSSHLVRLYRTAALLVLHLPKHRLRKKVLGMLDAGKRVATLLLLPLRRPHPRRSIPVFRALRTL